MNNLYYMVFLSLGFNLIIEAIPFRYVLYRRGLHRLPVDNGLNLHTVRIPVTVFQQEY